MSVYWGVLQEIHLPGSEEGRVGQRDKLTLHGVVPKASAHAPECSRAGVGLPSCKLRQRARPLYLLCSPERLLRGFRRPSDLISCMAIFSSGTTI